MDAVELNYPVDISKLRVVEDCAPTGASSIERCRDSHRRKDGTGSVIVLKSASWGKIPDAEFCRRAVKKSGCEVEELSEKHDSKGSFQFTSGPEFAVKKSRCEVEELSEKHDSKGSFQFTPGPKLTKARQRAGKMSRSGSGSSKRLCMAQPEDIASSVGVDDSKDMIDKLGSSPINEKIQVVKQRQKRGEKRNFKNSMKPRFDSFSIKSGFASIGVGAGGSNFLGVYGLKSEVHDITKLLDEISLNELLDGTCKCPSFGKDKGKKAAPANENFLDSVRKAWSVLPLYKPAQCQNVAETVSFPNKNLSTSPSAGIFVAARGVNGEKEDDSLSEDILYSNKGHESGEKPEITPNKPDSSLRQPKDVLERLALPPPKDLESLLLDAAKPSTLSRNSSDLRSGKQITRRSSLPPFPWSHAFNGHSRTNSDAVKFLTSRSTCQGGWVKIAKIVNSPGSGTCPFTDFESFTYDTSLVPVISKAESSENRIFPYTVLPSLATDSNSSRAPIEPAERCPRLLAAAQTLCDIAKNLRGQNLDGFLRWPKKPSEKAMKARKSKFSEKSEKYSTLSIMGSAKPIRHDADHISPSKRPRIAAAENRKGTIMPSPLSRSSIMHLSPTSLDKARNNQRKNQKLMLVD